jgi:1-deoxy-D-xylulose-5-phosphate reductoisomerase
MVDSLKKIAILGSTGSIGCQTLDVINESNGLYELTYLTTDTRIDILENHLKIHRPKGVVITNHSAYHEFKKTTNFKGKILFGEDGLIEAASDPDNDLVVSSLVGFSGVVPTLSAIDAGINIALANKETLVSAGSVITHKAHKNNVQIFAIDSEHSAISQCLIGESISAIEKIILTASGGPFLNTPTDEFENITVSMALAHPNWSMGKKITIDSATMMNKGFEVIEAYWLFGLELDKIEVVIHPQSIIHSLVQFVDGSIKAQLGKPDMRIPISYALSYPDRLSYGFDRYDLTSTSFTFQKPDLNRFPCLGLAYESLKIFGTAPTILNAANEIAVNAFLDNRIKFIEIPEIIERALSSINIVDEPDINTIIRTDRETRDFVKSLIR